jgi:SSS family solute:Na+ symporter
MWVGRAFTFVFMMLAAVWAPQIDRFPTLWEYLQTALSYIVPPIVALFLVGVLWPRANGHGAFAAIGVGVAAAAFLLACGGADWMPEIHFLYVATLLFGLSSLTLVAVSLLTAPPDPDRVHAFVWTRRRIDGPARDTAGRSWLHDYRVQAIGLLVLTAAVLVLFG